jgi:hypothetical protein
LFLSQADGVSHLFLENTVNASGVVPCRRQASEISTGCSILPFGGAAEAVGVTSGIQTVVFASIAFAGG